ncbi:MAG: tape measure protein [Armatimonadota bacterium]|nr:tape measure protein [bacterium]
MALKVGELYGELRLNDSGWKATMNSAQNTLQSLSSNLTALGATLTASVTLPIIGLGAAAIKSAGDMEQTKIALTTMLGSAQQATSFIKDVQNFAAKTPFEFSGLIQNSKQLIAFGFEANSIIPVMTNLGNAVASVGGNGDTINRIIMQLGQMKSIGKASMEDIRPIAEAGVPVFRYLAQGLGKSQGEISKMVGAGQLSAEAFMDGLMKGMSNDSKLKGMMDNQSKTFLGQWSNLKDQIFQTLVPLGEPLIKIAKDILKATQPLLDIVKRVAEGFAKSPKFVQILGVTFAGAAALAGPLLVVAGSIAGAIISIIAIASVVGPALGAAFAVATGPVGWVAGAILAVGAALVIAYKKIAPFRDAVNEACGRIKEAFGGLWDSIKKLWSVLAPVREVMGAVAGRAAKAALSGIAAVLKTISQIVLAVAISIQWVVYLLSNFFNLLFGGKNSAFSISAVKSTEALANIIYTANEKIKKDKKSNIAEAAQAEIDSIMDVIKKQREQAEERRQQLRDAMGFKGVTELWRMAMEAGIKGSLGRAKESTEITTANLPQAKELQEIRAETRRLNRQVSDLNSLIRDRLGVVSGT